MCLSGSYSGEHCEIVENNLEKHQILAKSFSYVAMTSIGVVVGYFLSMDVLKYVFGIDPIKQVQPKPSRRKRPKRKQATSFVRFTYVDVQPQNIQE